MNAAEAQNLVRKKRFLTVKEASTLLGVCDRFLYIRMGKPDGPPAHKRGRVWRIPTYEFLVWADRPAIN
jgi:hypothetical protein